MSSVVVRVLSSKSMGLAGRMCVSAYTSTMKDINVTFFRSSISCSLMEGKKIGVVRRWWVEDKTNKVESRLQGVELIEVYRMTCISCRSVSKHRTILFETIYTYFKVFQSLFGPALIQYVLSKSHFHVCSAIGKNARAQSRYRY